MDLVQTNAPRVLLVEDDGDGRRLYVLWLTEAGFSVKEAHNGFQALERAFENIPDVVVTDLNIPGIDGFELTRRLKLDPRTRQVPVIAVTGYAAFQADPDRARRAGCDVILEKPCSPDDLETAIRTLIKVNGARH
jgi:two-component system cell cycle response regulator DivK